MDFQKQFPGQFPAYCRQRLYTVSSEPPGLKSPPKLKTSITIKFYLEQSNLFLVTDCLILPSWRKSWSLVNFFELLWKLHAGEPSFILLYGITIRHFCWRGLNIFVRFQVDGGLLWRYNFPLCNHHQRRFSHLLQLVRWDVFSHSVTCISLIFIHWFLRFSNMYFLVC